MKLRLLIRRKLINLSNVRWLNEYIDRYLYSFLCLNSLVLKRPSKSTGWKMHHSSAISLFVHTPKFQKTIFFRKCSNLETSIKRLHKITLIHILKSAQKSTLKIIEIGRKINYKYIVSKLSIFRNKMRIWEIKSIVVFAVNRLGPQLFTLRPQFIQTNSKAPRKTQIKKRIWKWILNFKSLTFSNWKARKERVKYGLLLDFYFLYLA